MLLGRSGSPRRRALIDVVEDFSQFWATPGTAGTVKPYSQGEAIIDVSDTDFLFLQNIATIQPVNGQMLRRLAPGTNQTASAFGMFGMPFGRNVSLIPAVVRRQYRHVWDTVIARTWPSVVGVKCEVGLKDDALAITAANGGVALVSQSTVNGGNWSLWYYLTNGGVLQNGGDSGVTPDGSPQHFRFEYFDMYPSPTLYIYINSVLKFTLTGVTLPTVDGNEPHNICITSGDAVNTIGQVDLNYFNRYTVEPL